MGSFADCFATLWASYVLPMSLQARLIAALVAAIVILGVGFKIGLKIKQGEWDAATLSGKEAQEKALQAAAKAIAQIEVKQQTIVQKVQHEVQTKTVYRDCIVPTDGVRLLNDAVESRGKPAGGYGVPATSATP